MYFSSGTQLAAALAALPAGKVGQFLAFDALYYSNTYMLNGNTTGMTAIEHFVQYGALAMARPNAQFDPAYYKAAYADLASTNLNGADLLYHFMQFGLDEGRAPNATLAAEFDAAGYLAAYPTVAAYVNANLASFNGSATNGAMAHYVKFGQYQGFAEIKLAAAGQHFTLTDSTLGTAPAELKVMNLAGDQDVRIDMTNKTSQITGLDLNGNGSIANDGKENALNVHTATGYAAVDAYTRLDNGVVNETNLANVFLGDIKYDGTGFAGDGVTTNGNVVLGGLGADTILGGIGNDFLAAGGIALSHAAATESLSGGRNADFLFAELSLLSNTDGNKLFIDGGATADDTSAANGQSTQDSDWLLLQASDDDERIEVMLTENAGPVGTTPVPDGTLMTRAMQYATLRDIENLDASGNTYGFIKGLTAIGGAPVNANNNGIGSSGQLNVTGSAANNIIIGGYDNDAISGGAGNDTLLGGNMKSYGTDYLVSLGATNVATQQLLDPNLVGLTGNNDGRDELIGGTGNDNIAFEADGGIIEGGAAENADDIGFDTLWLTANSLGAVAAAGSVTPVAAAALTTDGVIRMDLAVGKVGGLDNAHGYGGADLNAATGNFTADQTNYTAANAGLRVQVQDMENVIATGLGVLDYKAAGGNTAADVTFANQQNFIGNNSDMDLRGTYSAELNEDSFNSFGNGNNNGQIPQGAAPDPTAAAISTSADGLTTTTVTPVKASGGAIVGTQTTVITAAVDGSNILYAGTGNDKLEGRTGNDFLSGNDGIDTFIFGTKDGGGELVMSGPVVDSYTSNQSSYGDNIDVIWRQSDVNAADKLAGKAADNLWDGVSYERDFGIGSSTTKTPSGLKLTLNVSAIDTTSNPLVQNDVRQIEIKVAGVDVILTTPAMAGAATMADLLTEVKAALVTHGDTALSASLLNNTITIADADGRVLGGTGYLVVQNSGGSIQNTVTFESALSNTVGDILLYTSYEDRLDGELTNDNSVNGSNISLGVDSYAQDRVVSFSDNDGKIQTRIAEDQRYELTFNNLTTQDTVTITVNKVQYQLTVGKELDGSTVAAEDGVGDTQAGIQAAFLSRLTDFINSFMDANTAAGQVRASLTGSTIALTQVTYNGEETVFMKSPVVTLTNTSGGQPATVTVVNAADHEVLLYEYNGLNNGLNNTNVKFIGATGDNQSKLETMADAAGASITLSGNEAVVIDGGIDNLVANVTNTPLPATTTPAAIANNTNTNALLSTNFSVHGDDLLIGGKANDTIYGRTGDDRVIGSLGTDTLDGGKSWYAVQVLNEAKLRVVEMNLWEAASPAARVAALTGLQVITTTLINQTQDGANLVSGLFNDTLLFQQADFDSAKTTFTITLDKYLFDTTTKVVSLNEGGAGHVGIDVAGDGVLDVGQVTTFTNFENIRTVSGTGNAVANDGQGNDTLNVAGLSRDTGGISYDLTNRQPAVSPDPLVSVSNAGDVRYSKDADKVDATVNTIADPDSVTLFFPDENDFEELVMKVDGVENLVGGIGADLLMIDETEAAKNNSFDGNLGLDRIQYMNDYVQNTFPNADLEPTVTIKLDNIAAVTSATTGVDTVTMTGGRVGSTVAVDSLTAIERIALEANTAAGLSEADTLDVTAMTDGAVVDYTNGQVRGAVSGVVHVTVEGLPQVEVVMGAAANNDTVIVGNSGTMDNNAREDDAQGTPTTPLGMANFLDYDDLSAAKARIVFGSDPALITQTLNQNEFKFSLGTTGVDTVDYSQTTDIIAAVVNFKTDAVDQYVFVGVGDDDLVDAGNRVDQLTGVERIVASKVNGTLNTSILDLTASNQDLKITFSNNFDDTKVTSWDANFAAGKYGREVHEIKVANALSSTSVINTTYLDYTYVDTSTIDTTTIPTNARWTGVEGSDKNETVELSAYEAGSANELNLRGGNNKVTYEGKSLAATIKVVDYVAANAATTGRIEVTAVHTAIADDHNPLTVADPTTSNTDFITSYSQQNKIATGVLTIKATRTGEDSFQFDPATTADKLYVFGGAVDATPSINVRVGAGALANSLELIGFELVQDSNASDDVYDIVNFAGISPELRLKDEVAVTDHDTLKVANNVAGLDGDANAATIDLAGLRNATNNTYLFDNGTADDFHFDVLDVTQVTGTTITTVAGSADLTDELVVGNLPGIVNVSLFESLVLTQDYVTAYGSAITINTDTFKVTDGTKVLTADASLRTVSLGGIALDGSFSIDSLLTVTGAVSLTAVGTAPVTLIGGSGANTITGAGGNDTLRGGAGNDILDGSFTAEVTETQVVTLGGGILDAGDTITIEGIDIGVAGVGIEVAVVAGASASQIGNAFVAYANVPANLTTLSTSLGEALSSVTYDSGNQRIQFNFSSATGAVANGLVTLATGLTTSTITATLFDNTPGLNGHVDYAPRVETLDTYVFEATAVLNGADTINNFNATNAGTDDLLDFTAFLGAAGSSDGDQDESATAEIMTLTGGENIGLFYDSAALTSARVELSGSGTIAIGDVVIDDNAKAVVLVTADVDGITDATNQAYSVYFIQDTDTTAGFNAVVTLVGTINSATELSATNLFTGTDSFV